MGKAGDCEGRGAVQDAGCKWRIANGEWRMVRGEGVLDEDGWFRPKDEVYARLRLYNLLTGGVIERNSNTVEHYF